MLFSIITHALPITQLMRKPDLYAALDTRRGINSYLWLVPEPRIHASQCIYKGHVLKRLHGRHAARPSVDLGRTRKRCAKVLKVTRPGVAILRIEDGLQFSDKP